MRAVYAILLCVSLCPFLSARADVIISGHVSTSGGATGCSESGAEASNFSLTCNGTDPTSTAMVSGQGDALSGFVSLDMDVLAPGVPPIGSAMGLVQLELNEEYVLTGGTGSATVDFVVDRPFFSTAGMSCGFTFNGISQFCDPGAGMITLPETVQYGVPFFIGLNLGINGGAQNGAPQEGRINYDFTQAGLQVVPTPEPSSILLLMPGLAGVMFAAKSSLKTRLG